MYQRQLRPSSSQGVEKLAVSTPWRKFSGRMAKLLAPVAANVLARGQCGQRVLDHLLESATMYIMSNN